MLNILDTRNGIYLIFFVQEGLATTVAALALDARHIPASNGSFAPMVLQLQLGSL